MCIRDRPYTVMGESTYLPFGAEDGEEAAAGAVDEPAAEDDGADYSDKMCIRDSI